MHRARNFTTSTFFSYIFGITQQRIKLETSQTQSGCSTAELCKKLYISENSQMKHFLLNGCRGTCKLFFFLFCKTNMRRSFIHCICHWYRQLGTLYMPKLCLSMLITLNKYLKLVLKLLLIVLYFQFWQPQWGANGIIYQAVFALFWLVTEIKTRKQE